MELLEQVGIPEKARSLPSTLSGGQRQRVAIARALANRPAMLLADEPTGALDSKTGHEVLELFSELHRQGNTILMVTHDLSIAALASRQVEIHDGKVASETSKVA
jgi:putative ABC transport system ATP-binding protein